jgi:WD40 repeat protein
MAAGLFLLIVLSIHGDADRPILTVQAGHVMEVTTMAWSSDGAFFATGSADRTVKLWDSRCRLVRGFSGFEGAITSVAFAPDGGSVLAASQDGTVRILPVDGTPQTVIGGFTDRAMSAAFSPDGRRIYAIGTDRDETPLFLRAWTASGVFVAQRYLSQPFMGEALAVHPDGVVSAFAANAITFFRASDLEVTGSVQAEVSGASGDGRYWFGPANSGGKKVFRITSARDGSPVKTLDPAGAMIIRIDHTTKGLLAVGIVTHGETGTAQLIDVSGGTVLLEIPLDDPYPPQAAFSKDGKEVLIATSKSIRLFRLDGSLVNRIPLAYFVQSRLALHPDGHMIAALVRTVDRERIVLWDRGGHLLSAFDKPLSSDCILEFTPDGEFLAHTTKEETTLWNLRGDFVKKVPARRFLPGNRTLSAAGSALEIRNPDGSIAKTLALAGAYLTSEDLAFSPDLSLAVLSDSQESLNVLDLDSGRLVASFQPFAFLTGFAWCPADGTIAVFGQDDPSRQTYENTLKLYDLQGRLLRTFYAGTVTAAAISADGRRIASGSINNTIRVWDKSGELVRVLSGHTNAVEHLRFTPDGRFLVSSSRDASLRIWDLATGSSVVFLERDGE